MIVKFHTKVADTTGDDAQCVVEMVVVLQIKSYASAAHRLVMAGPDGAAAYVGLLKEWMEAGKLATVLPIADAARWSPHSCLGEEEGGGTANLCTRGAEQAVVDMRLCRLQERG